MQKYSEQWRTPGKTIADNDNENDASLSCQSGKKLKRSNSHRKTPSSLIRNNTMHEFFQFNHGTKEAAAPTSTTTLSSLLQKTAKNSNNLPLMDQLSLFEQKPHKKSADSGAGTASPALMSMAPKKPIDRRPASARYL